MTTTGSTPTYKLLIEDPQLSVNARKFLRESEATIQTTEDANKAATILNKYRQLRGLYDLAANIDQKLNKEGDARIDVDRLLEETATAINVARSKKSTVDAFLHFGRNNNSSALVKDILYADNSEAIIPTGVEVFDSVSGGFARGALVTIGANSGGGKSLTANAIAINMATMGYKVLLVPLEMSKKEMTSRTLSNITKFNVSDIILQRLATNERDLVFKRYKRWAKKVKDAGGRYTIFKPQEDMTIEEIVAATSAYECDVMIIDYISLLKGMDGDDMWRALGGAARYAKINAEIENRVNILLCQVSDDGKIRYARAISEHSSNSWVWTSTKESKETGITVVEQPKSRNSMAFPFTIKMNYAQMRLETAPQQEDLGNDTSLAPTGKGKKETDEQRASRVRKKREGMPNLAMETDL